ncbi:MAG: hypothetical protein Hens3KO_22390 [Henriciella sp.]
MQWLISQIWIALAAAGVLGILFGMAFRGLLTENRIRRARVDRDIAKTELDQTRLELDELYAAQRKRQKDSAEAVSGGDKLAEELAERETRITSLSDELKAARSELDTLKSEQADAANDDASSIAKQAGAALVGAGAGAILAQEDEALKERNTWLEERVSALEAELSAVPVALGADQAEDAPEASEAEEDLARLRWRNRYLESRVAYFEGAEGAAAAEASADSDAAETSLVEEASVTPISSLLSDTEEPSEPEAVEEPDAATEATNSEDQEAVPPVDEEETSEGTSLVSAEESTDETSDETDPPEAEINDSVHELSEPDTGEVAEEAVPLEQSDDFEDVVADIAGDVDEHPSDAVLKELIDLDIERIQPEQVESSDDDDDLTQISGIGPKIAELLNELGIFTHEQIASWTPENAAWVDQHLSFSGRVERENWIEQAEELLIAASEADTKADA